MSIDVVDTDINSYSVPELLQFINLTDIVYDEFTITTAINQLKFANKSQDTHIFLDQVRDKILLHISTENMVRDGLSNSAEVSVLSGTVERLLLVDSTYRDNILPLINITNFQYKLSEHLNNVTSITLQSIKIPYSWYNIDAGCNSFYLYYNSTYYAIIIDVGRYTYEELRRIIQLKLNAINESVLIVTVEYTQNGHFSFQPNQDISLDFIKGNQFSNYNLGWILGIKNNIMFNIGADEIYVGQYLASINDPKNLILSINDYTIGGPATSLIGFASENTSIRGSSYDTANTNINYINYVKPNNELNINNSDSFIDLNGIEQSNNGLYSINETGDAIIPVPNLGNILPSSTEEYKQYTQAALHSINMKADTAARISLNSCVKQPIIRDTFCVIPMNYATKHFALDFLDSAMQYTRTYSKPVLIERLDIKLYGANGRLLDLQGRDWSMCLSIKQKI
jgi:hypothetical protein